VTASTTTHSIWASPEGRAPWAEVTVGPNRVALLRDGYQAYPAMLAAIQEARQTVCLETYILRDDTSGLRFINALIERAQAGVLVLLMYDFWGSQVSEETLARLADAGVKVKAFGPVRFTHRLGRIAARLLRRNHRKSLTVDGVVGFTGGLNIANDYAAVEDGGAGWRDTHVRVVGPSAADLERLFLATWRQHRGPAFDAARFDRPPAAAQTRLRIVGNDFPIDRKGIRRAYLEAFDRATSSIYLTHAYFLPPARMLKALTHAARRGVRVAVIVAATTDVKLVLYATRGLYARLLKAGIEVYEWQAGRVLHAKTAVSDGRWGTVGSSNLDPMSLRNNLEVNALILDAQFARALERLFLDDLLHCTRVTLEGVRAWGLGTRLLSFVATRLRRWL
jgi:cardiolipin synthase A/B